MDLLVPFVVLVVALAVAGIGLGILVARPLDRWTSGDDEPPDEGPGGDDRPPA